MDGATRSMIVGIGTDIQIVDEMKYISSLLYPDLMFTQNEIDYICNGKNKTERLATLFSVKEAFFKALPSSFQWAWIEIELKNNIDGSPYLSIDKIIAAYPLIANWNINLSLSHSGGYVQSFVIIED